MYIVSIGASVENTSRVRNNGDFSGGWRATVGGVSLKIVLFLREEDQFVRLLVIEMGSRGSNFIV